MKVVILAGGMGTRISEESHLVPKPMIEIGGRPLLWHIMKLYSHYGFDEFIICLGYRGYQVKEYFNHYLLHASDVTFDFKKDHRMIYHQPDAVEKWRVTLVDTGEKAETGDRVRRVRSFIGEEPFMMTYGDGLSDIPLDRLLDFHRSHGRLATVTSVQPSGRFGTLEIGDEERVLGFREKVRGDEAWINAGFFIFEPGVFDFLEGENVILEQGPLEQLAEAGQLFAYKHPAFWHPMDTLRDKRYLESLWQSGKVPWKVWEKRPDMTIGSLSTTCQPS